MELTAMSELKIPSRESVIDQVKSNIPLELLDMPIWLAYYYKRNKDGTLSKPPCSQQGYTVSDDKLGVTFDIAVKDGYPGIKINKHTNLIAFDIDDKEAKLGKREFKIENLSKDFREFIVSQDTYMELSPSKCGLRILMKCEDKKGLPGRANLSKEKCIGGELYINSGYVTITGDALAGESIKEVSPYQLKQWYGKENKKAKQADVINIPKEFSLPSLQNVLQNLNLCKLNQSERVKQAYKIVIGQDYNHYDYWLRIMMACHYYAVKSNQMNEMTDAIVKWSRNDELSYESDDDVINRWSSFKIEENGTTYHTLTKFANLLKFKWPREKLDKDGNPTGKPIPTDLINFEYMMDFHNIKIYCDLYNQDIYLTGDKDIINKYYLSRNIKSERFGFAGPFTMEYIASTTCSLAQSSGYESIAPNFIMSLFRNYINGRIYSMNMLKMWLETPPEELSEEMIEEDTDIEKSNLDYLMSCITFSDSQDQELARMFFDTMFYEMVMPIYNPKRILSQRSFMLILTGPENCRKTTFFSMLFPTNLRQQFVTNSTETLKGAKSIRDFSSSLVTSALVVTDEFEIFYNKANDSLFKTLVTSDVIDYIPIYEKTMKKHYKNAVLAGTTNKRSLPFEQDSNRRLAIIDVEWIDTTSMEIINWHHFYRDYVAKGRDAMKKHIYPWKLSKEAIRKQYDGNERFRAQSNLEIMIRETFDFDMITHDEITEYDKQGLQTNKELYKLSDIVGTLKQRYPDIKIKPAELKHVLKSLCGKYTHTVNTKEKLGFYKDGYIKDGILKQNQYTRYVMPPLLTDVF